MRIFSIIIYIFVKIRMSDISLLSEKELEQLRKFSIAGCLLFIPDIALFLITGGGMASLFITGGIGIDIILILISLVICILNNSNRKKITSAIKNPSVLPPNSEIIDENHTKIDASQTEKKTYDLYALIISLVTLPTLIFIYMTNVTKKEVSHGGSWATTSTRYSIPDSITSIIILLLIASIAVSMYLTLHKGKNNSNKAVWVKILNVINVVGGIIILSI